ncbi:hypothetical protein JRO89_XS08G0112100 [Xanthoceras sorbifolium]|uniref:Uncharacterized protein n=1 Tax=Xanthoceras sorbifolium TaxID=99658 RepID=A0ABQ8HPB5_9ROSI|nr:hypothetical protein JRO89_XS08G0112100 [Xanthoceras sorbifolium]
MANPGDDNSEKPKSKEHVENVETTPPMSSPTSAPAPTVEGGILGSLRADRGSAAGDGDAVEVDTGYGEATPPGGDQDSGFENQLAREENGIFFSRDVVFHEEIFPFHTVVPSTSLLDPFPNLVLLAASSSDLPHHLDYSDSPAPVVSPAHVLVPSAPVLDLPAPALVKDSRSSQTAISSPVVDLRRSSRAVRPPSYLKDYHCNLLTGSAISSPVVAVTHLPSSPYCAF